MGKSKEPSPGLLSNQGEKSIHFFFVRVPLRQKVLKCGTPKPSPTASPPGSELKGLGFRVPGVLGGLPRTNKFRFNLW